jgi:putative SOS response-associated peptidase YedK
VFVVCGRFNLRTPAAAWAQALLPLWTDDEIASRVAESAIAARFNIAPTQEVSCIHAGETNRRLWSLFRWGLVPSWADDLTIGSRMINARSETVDEKRSFKQALAARRCLIPADGYYEWVQSRGGKQPYLIEQADGGVLAMAGLWECNHKIRGEGHPIYTVTVLTTSANQAMRCIHDRMPVILDRDRYASWLDPDIQDPKQLKAMLRPAPDDLLRAYPVSKIVNSPKNDIPECIEPIVSPDQPLEQRSLF